MVVEANFKFDFITTIIIFCNAICCYGSFINDGAFAALSLHWAAGFSPAVARWYSAGRLGSFGKKRFVVSGNYGCHVGHATIARFDIIFIAYFVQAVMGREVLLEQVKEDLSDVSLYMLAEGWVKPHYVPFSGFPFMGAGWVMYCNPPRCPLLCIASSHSGIFLVNSSRLCESDERRSASIDGSCFFIAGGWFECWWYP